MRISSDMLYRQGLAAMLDQQSALARAQEQLSTNRKYATAADNPADYAQGLSLDQHLGELDRYQSNIDTAQHRLRTEETALGNVTQTLQRVRELAVQANNATLSDSDRAAISEELKQRLQDLYGYANQDDGTGHYIFAGSGGSAAFANATYRGDQTARLIAIAPGRSVADGDPGSEVFQRVKNGDGTLRASAGANTGNAVLAQVSLANPAAWTGGSYTVSFAGGNYSVRDASNTVVASGAYSDGGTISFAGVDLKLTGTPVNGDSFTVASASQQDLFATVQSVIDAAGTTGASARHNAIFNNLQDLDQAINHVLDVRAGVGARLNTLSDASASNSAVSEQLQQSLAGVRDTNVAETVSRMQQLLTSLQAAQQTFIKVQGLSLFDYLR